MPTAWLNFARKHKYKRKLCRSEVCSRARRDGAQTIGLHTSPVMSIALPMYLRMGFVHFRDIPNRNGLPYAVYTLSLST
jgi:hypothetical protein